MVIDNAPCHSGIESLFDDPEFAGHSLLRLGPYSPMLNPIEHVWSVLKAYVKRILSERLTNITTENGNGLSVRELRTRCLERIIGEGVNSLEPYDVNRFITGIQRLIPNVLEMQDVEF